MNPFAKPIEERNLVQKTGTDKDMAIDIIKSHASIEHAAAPWGTSPLGHLLNKAAELLEGYDYSEIEEEVSVKSYRPKPIEVLAVQWTGDNLDQVRLLCDAYYGPSYTHMEITTQEGTAEVLEGEWIVKTINEISVLSDHHFKEQYE